jgi:hypothetical protein
MVVGCRRPIVDAEAPEPIDAATVASIQDAIAVLDRELAPDAAPPDEPPPPVFDCNAPGTYCNPPPLEILCKERPDDRRCPKPKPPPCVPPASCNPPPPIGRIVRTEVSSGGVLVTVEMGSDQGLRRDATAKLIKESGDPIPRAEVTLIRVNKRTSIWRIAHVPLDVVSANPRIRVTSQ